MRLVAVVSAFGCLLSARAGEVRGTVYVREGQTRHPAGEVRVIARSTERGGPIQIAQTDVAGRYSLQNLPRTRIWVTVAQRGYCVRAVDSADPVLVVDMRAEAVVSPADFEILPGGVVTGRVSDQSNEPVEKAGVILHRLNPGKGVDFVPAAKAQADDQGRYRLYGLDPGRYVLVVRARQRLNDEPALMYYPGTSKLGAAREIEVKAGAEITGIDVAMRPEPTFRVAGKVAEADPGSERIWVLATRADAALEPFPVATAQVTAQGDFLLAGLRAGGYVLTAGAANRKLARKLVDVQADATGVVLRPTRPGRLEGRVSFLRVNASRPVPPSVRLRLSERGLPPVLVAAQAPDYRFEAPELWPGSYAVEIAGPEGAYVTQLTVGSEGAAGLEITMPEGGAVRADLQVGLDAGLVTGLVKAVGATAGQPHARIALARPGSAPVEFLSAQADQKGRFVLSGVQPGEYLIGAWTRLDAARLYEPRIWDLAGRAVKRLRVEPNLEVDLDLTAAP